MAEALEILSTREQNIRDDIGNLNEIFDSVKTTTEVLTELAVLSKPWKGKKQETEPEVKST